MVPVDTLLVATLLSTAMLALVLGYLYSTERSGYLKDWAIHWTLVSLGLALTLSPWGSAVGTVAMSNQLIALGSAFYLARGALALQGRPWPGVGWPLLALVAAWIVMAPLREIPFIMETLPSYGLRAGLTIWGGVLLIRLPENYGGERWVPGLALVIDGLHLADYPFLGQSPAFLPWALVLSVSNRFLIGVGMLLLYFRQARQAAEQSERQFRSAFESSPMATTLGDFDTGRVIDANRALSEILGYEPEEFIGTIPAEEPIWVDPDRREEMMARIQEDGRVDGFRAEMRHKNGEIRTISLTAAAIPLPEGKRLLVMGHDVTERERAEVRLRRLVGILEATPDLVAIWGREGSPIYLNGAARDLLGIADETAVPEFDIRGVLDADLLKRALQTALRAGSWTGETTLHLEDGRRLAVSMAVIAHRDEDGMVRHFSSLARDISDLRDLQGQLLQSQKLEALGRLAGGVAHDFNNLLTVIGGYAESLEETSASEDQRWAAREIRLAHERAAGLTRQLLAFARKQQVDPRVFSVDEALLKMDKMLRRLIGEDVRLTVSPNSGCQVHMDPAQFDQVIINLVVNARDALVDGGAIAVTSRRLNTDDDASGDFTGMAEGELAMIVVSDDGFGMDEATKARAFDPFFTTKQEGKGTGLGLSTVYGIVQQAGGTVRLESAVGRGTAVGVVLPAVGAAEDPPEVAGDGDEIIVPGGRVLVVEDEHAVRQLVARQLRALGCQVVEARDGLEGLRCIDQEPDLAGLVTDVVMPEASGGSVAGHFLEVHPSGGVVLMSGYTDRHLQEGLLETPGVEFVQKPFTRDRLAQALRNAIAARRKDE